ncbi:MAG: hypothetical protein JWO38_2510 [Gemmataceae bacterium]|nr:hypothetical protein [Gemmataceae bacterium]
MTVHALEPALRTVEPAARLVSERHLRKVLLYLHDHGRPVALNPDLPFWAAREDLLAADVLPPEVLAADQPRYLLLTSPADRQLDTLPPGDQLRAYWRLLLRAEVMAAVDRRLAAGSLTPAACADRLDRFGPAAVREIQCVLETDGLVDPAADRAAVFRVFAAVYLDLHAFAPALARDFFPSLPPADVVAATLAEDVDPPAVLARTRPAGASDPGPEILPCERPGAVPPVPPPAGVGRGSLLVRAADAEKKENFVRAAILSAQAAGAGDHLARAAAAAALGKLVRDLAGVLKWDDATAREWREALAPLLASAAVGYWPRAARCLYELQKISGELSREVYAVDLIEYVRTLGRRAVKRPLPHARDVMLLKRLRAAHKQLLRSGLGERAQARLDQLFHDQMHGVERAVRAALTPVVAAALAGSGFRPENRVEEIARDKVVAELLDRACERGYLRIGDLRDAIARNQLKMPDLAGPGELVVGDPLLRADTRLAYDLDGVYRRGEVYLRALQRGSSVFFGTRVGRLLTLYAIAPFLAAFLTLMALEELRHIGGKVYSFASTLLTPPPAPVPRPPLPPPEARGRELAQEVELGFDEETDQEVWIVKKAEQAATLGKEVVTSSAAAPPSPEGHHHSVLIAWPTVVGLGVFLLFVFHVPPFRRAVLTVVRAVWRVVRAVLWDLPRALLRSPVVVRVWYSPPARYVSRHLGGAIVFTVVVVALLWFLGMTPLLLLEWGGFEFVVAAVILNTPWGWVVQERLATKIAQGWRVVRVNLLPGLVAVIVDWFRRLANWVERRLYAVDEWLRFRGGDSHSSFVLKAVLGLLWFPVAYVARFAFYLLIEPQINPVKHFPVVTVSHKVILPMTPSLATALGVSDATAAGLLACIPGVFGFIAWELGANWRLYRGNRPDRLRPVVIGSHGESMRGLLRPGFHSGTVPRLYRKLRAAGLRGDRAAATRYHHDLDHTREAVRMFVERELIARLDRATSWGGLRISVAAVRFGCQRVVIEVAAPALGRDPFSLGFENRAGRVGTMVVQAGWFDKLTAGQRATLLAAVRGLLDMAAADWFEECERVSDPADGRGPATCGSYPELLRSYTWAEWVSRWEEIAPAAK